VLFHVYTGSFYIRVKNGGVSKKISSQGVYKRILLGQENEYLNKKRKKKFLFIRNFAKRDACQTCKFGEKFFEKIMVKFHSNFHVCYCIDPYLIAPLTLQKQRTLPKFYDTFFNIHMLDKMPENGGKIYYCVENLFFLVDKKRLQQFLF
jgi:hypothetical protein